MCFLQNCWLLNMSLVCLFDLILVVFGFDIVSWSWSTSWQFPLASSTLITGSTAWLCQSSRPIGLYINIHTERNTKYSVVILGCTLPHPWRSNGRFLFYFDVVAVILKIFIIIIIFWKMYIKCNLEWGLSPKVKSTVVRIVPWSMTRVSIVIIWV